MNPSPTADELVLRPDAPEDEWLLRHLTPRRPYRVEDRTDAVDRALGLVFRAYLIVVAIMVFFAIVAAIRHDWPPGVILIPIFAAAVIFAFGGFIWAACWGYAEAVDGDFFPRRVDVYRDRVELELTGHSPLELPIRTMTVAWGKRGSDSFVWRPAPERALLLCYWGWKYIPDPWGGRRCRATFAITGTDEHLASAYTLLLDVGIRPRRPTRAEVLAEVLAVVALAAGLWAAWVV